MEAREQHELLQQGEYLITRERHRVGTVLGSCVAVTLFCARTHDAAVCHGVLPRPGRDEGQRPSEGRKGRYLSEVVPLMIEHFFSQGCRPGEIEAKVFGGAALTPHAPGQTGDLEVGIENVATALGTLLGSGLRLRASNTGGAHAHRIIFDTQNGEVLHQLLRSLPLSTQESP